MKAKQLTWTEGFLYAIAIGIVCAGVANKCSSSKHTEDLKCGKITGSVENYATPKHPAEYFIIIRGHGASGETLKVTIKVDRNTYETFKDSENFCACWGQ